MSKERAMTREEAIEWLTDIKTVTENWAQEVAIDMAIESLSEPQMVETIRITMSNGDIYYHDFGAERRE